MKPDFLASRLNVSVIVFRGHTRNEMLLISAGSWFITALFLGSSSLLLCHQLLIGVGLSFPLAIPVGWCSATFLQKFKAGKPRGYLTQRCRIELAQRGWITSPFVLYSGPWSVRRWS